MEGDFPQSGRISCDYLKNDQKLNYKEQPFSIESKE